VPHSRPRPAEPRLPACLLSGLPRYRACANVAAIRTWALQGEWCRAWTTISWALGLLGRHPPD
jgi:hypothetical protein